jgi:antitoxin component YwqK of YwqJK toxin-antitoxin module
MIIEKNGIYYSGDCETHADKKYSGTSCYYYDNGKVKGTYTILNGLPDGHWERFDSTGKKTIDLYFDDGKLINKTFNK